MGTLLGFLAQFGTFSSQGEVLCTQGLAYLLREHPAARAAFADELAARTAVNVSHDLTWLAEQHQRSDRGRPDLEAHVDKTPIVKVEAKLDALLDPTQFRSYVSDLQARLHGQSLEGILLVLVPAVRTNQAADVIKGELGLDGAGPWRARKEGYPDVAIAVVSWDDVLAALGRVESQGFRNELQQFEGMYRELRSPYIAPLAGREDVVKWRARESDFIRLVDLATRRLTTGHSVYPMGIEPLEQEPEGLEAMGYNRRYVCQPLGDGKPPCLSIGARDPFAGSDTPVWLRFNRATGRFADIRDRLESSDLAPRLVMSGGHIWIPLDVPLAADAEQMVNALVAQAEEVRQVAYRWVPS